MFYPRSPSEPEDGAEGAAGGAATGQQQSSASAGVHVPSPGVGHQHGLLQPLDGPPVEPEGDGRKDLFFRMFLQGDFTEGSLHATGLGSCDLEDVSPSLLSRVITILGLHWVFRKI